jgi:hypothetical protein
MFNTTHSDSEISIPPHMLHPQKNTVTTQKIQLFRREEKPLARVMQSLQKYNTSPLSQPF